MMGGARPVATGPPASAHSSFATDDPNGAHEYICRQYSKTRMRPIGDQTSLRMRDEQHELGPITVSEFSHTAGLEQVAEPIDRLMVARVMSGRWQRDTIGEQAQIGRGDVCLIAQPDRPCYIRWDAAVQMQFVWFDPSVLLDVAAAPRDMVPRFTSLSPVSADGQQLLSRVLDYVVHEVVANEAVAQSPISRTSTARTLAAAMLEVFPNNAVRDPVVSDRIDGARSRVLRGAVAYLHDHAHEDVSVRDLAEAVGASRQAVHLAFRQHLQTTPGAYLEQVRLDRVHRDLTDLDPQSTTVEQIARLWGFNAVDRFRRYYCHTFGISPEQTLHR